MDIQRYYVTFGVQYTGDPATGEVHPLGMTRSDYCVVEAPDYKTARGIIQAVFGQQYAFDYDEANFVGDGTKDRWYKDREPALTIAWVQK